MKKGSKERNGSRLHFGCCGFRRARSDYFKLFSSVEVQHTFYDPPQVSTLSTWKTEAPEGFVFTLKAWQLITHAGDSPTYRRTRNPLNEIERMECGYFRPTTTVQAALTRTLECAAALHARAVLFQCPPKFVPSEENLHNLAVFFSQPRPNGLLYAWEPRGNWPQALVYEVCSELNLLHVVDPFTADPVTSKAYYFRIMGKRGRGFTFTDDQLKELAVSVDPKTETFVFFNHLAMLEDAGRFSKLL